MYVWSKRIVIGLLAAFVLGLVVFLTQGQLGEDGALKMLTTSWIILNYVGLVLWIFVWMIDQTRMRGKNVWVWLLPFLLAPLPTLMALILFQIEPEILMICRVSAASAVSASNQFIQVNIRNQTLLRRLKTEDYFFNTHFS